MSVSFVRGQAAYFRRRGFDAHLISSPGTELQQARRELGIATHEVRMAREIDLRADIAALRRLVRILRACDPNWSSPPHPRPACWGCWPPAWSVCPCGYTTSTGCGWKTAAGAKRRILRLAERATAACATRVICVSRSLRDLYVQMKLAPAGKVAVLGAGSSHGVDAARYQATPELRQRAADIRSKLGIPAEAPVVGFVGRLTRDKGIEKLLEAFALVRANVPAARLLLRGDFEPGDPLPAEAIRTLLSHPQISVAPFGDHTEAYYQAMDVLAFPSCREELPNVPLEAAAAGLAVVGFVATGTIDAVIHGLTGVLVPPGDATAMGEAIVRYLQDAALRHSHGAAGRQRILRDFRPETVWGAFYQECMSLLRGRGLPFE